MKYEEIYEGGKEEPELSEHEYDELFMEHAYDEEGSTVACDWCHHDLVWKDGEYYCPECDEVWSRQKFFDYIGAELPGPECITCDNKYPGCIICQYGYVEDDEII